MNADIFENDIDVVSDKFKKVLILIIFCYKKIIKEISFNLSEWETFIRNIFIKYLRDNKNDFWLELLSFEAETEEIWEDFTTYWFIDIKVWNVTLYKWFCNEDEYFAFECKRLDWYSTKNEEYVSNWLNRFIKGQYSKYMNIAWMIWFIQWFKKWENIDNLVDAIWKKVSNLAKSKIDKDFEHSYLSNHKRNKKLWNIDIYHLFFDFT